MSAQAIVVIGGFDQLLGLGFWLLRQPKTAFLSPIWMWYDVIMGSFSLIWSLLVQQGSGSPLPEYYSILQQIRVPPISWKKNAMTNICFECGISIYWHIGLASRALVQNESWTCCHRAVCMQEVEVDCHTSPLFGCCKETYFRDRRKLPCCSTMLELIHCDPCLRGCSATDVPQPSCLPQLIAFLLFIFESSHLCVGSSCRRVASRSRSLRLGKLHIAAST